MHQALLMSVSKSRFLSVFILVMAIVVAGTYDLTGQITFSHRFFYDYVSVASNVVELPEGYLISGVAHELVPDALIRRQFFRKIDHNGNVLSSELIGNDSLEFLNFGNVNTWVSDEVFLIGTTSYIDGINHASLFWLSSTGEVFFRKDYLSPSFDADNLFSQWMQPTDVCSNENGDIFLSAIVASPTTGSDYCVFKIDQDGDVVWTYLHATIAEPDACYEIKPTADGGVLISMTEENVIEDFILSKLIELDSEGQVLNIQEMPLEPTINDFVLVGESIVVATLRVEGWLHVTGHVYKTGLNGQLEWETNLGGDAAIEQQMYHVVESNDNAYIFAGNRFESIPDNDQNDGLYNWYGWLVKVDDDGMVVWDRRYRYVISTQDEHKVYDLKATNDGGFIFCGQATDHDFDNPDVELPIQQAWVVKVDQYGCLVPDCHVGVEEFAKREGLFKIGPNPVSQGDLLHIYVTDIQSLSQASIEVHDMQGKLVTSIQDLASSVTYILPIDDIPVGTYVVSLLDRGLVVDSEKLVVR